MSNVPIESLKEKFRQFRLSSFAIDNSTSIFILTFMILFFGISSYNTMPKEAFPEIPWPKIYVNTVYFGNSASDMESLVTRPIEKELQSVSEIKNVTSSSLQDYSLIVAEFQSNVDLDVAIRKVKDAVDKAKSELPNDLTQEPEVLDINLSETPIMTVNVSGNFPNEELKEYAELLEDDIEELSEISKIDLKGAQEREVKIDIDLPSMESTQVSFTDIENAIRSENITMSGGEIVRNDFRRTIRVIGEFESVRELENLIVKAENQNPIYLRDIANVRLGFKEKTSIARADELPVISLNVIKQSGQNLLSASDKIKKIIRDAKRSYLPKGVKISIFNDQSIQTRDMVSNLENSIISGVILVVLVLLFFLGLRNAMFVGIAIPLSMLMGILIINLVGYTLNTVVLFSLILALGMLVDNAIVVVENVYRFKQNGYSNIDAAKRGTGEVALPIIASTATTLAAFFPMIFWPGLVGSFMRYLPITLIIVLSSSLFVALVINPVVTATFIKIDERADSKAARNRKLRNVLIGALLMILVGVAAHFSKVMWARNVLGIVVSVSLLNYFILRPAAFAFQNSFLPLLEKGYNNFIRFALRGVIPVLIFFGTIGLLFGAFLLLGANQPEVEFFPSPDPNFVNAFVELPLGSDIEATNMMMKKLETKVTKVVEPYGAIVQSVLAQIGENTSDPNAGPNFGASPNRARLTVTFVSSKERGELSTAKAMEDIREAVKGIPGVQITVDKDQSGPPQEKPIFIEIQGENIDTLALLSKRMIAFINSKNIAGIEELKADVNIGKPEMTMRINRDAARRYGVSTFAIADAIRTAVFGKEVSKFKDGEDDYPITLRLDEKYRYSVDDLLNQKITFRNPANGRISQVPISTVAEISFTSTYSSINRKEQERVISVTSNVIKPYNANLVVDEIKEVLEEFPMPDDFTYKFAGGQEQQAEELAFLSSAFLIAMFSIFIILVGQFNSVISPFIIIISVIFSTIGVLLGYVFTGMDIEIIMTGVGIISLAGIVVNNAIVLIDYTNLVVDRVREKANLVHINELKTEAVKDAVIEGGATRLRPVLLTAITTVLGLIPLAVGLNINFSTLITDLDPQYFIGGDNAAFWGTMAWTVIYGLVFATFLTLVVIPVMYWLAYRLKRLATLKFMGRGNKEEMV